MRAFVALLIVGFAGGCDRLFGLVELADPLHDASTDQSADVGGPDGDGDGVPDAIDNCPAKPNPSQGDEDRDGLGDLCDTCIGTPDPLQVDTDQDGVGDLCDPTGEPTTILYKYGVDGGDPVTDWNARNGSWTATSDVITSVQQAVDANFMLDQSLPGTGDLTVEIGFLVTAKQTAAGVTAWVQVDANAPPQDGIHCGPRTGPVAFQLVTRASGVDTATLSAGSPAQPFTADPVRLWARNTFGRYISCGETATTSLAAAQTASNVPRKIGLHTYQASVEFQYVIVYWDP